MQSHANARTLCSRAGRGQVIHSTAPRNRSLLLASTPKARQARCQATPGPALPQVLPLFPVQPMGVFLPGMTKTLHLYESHFIAMMEDALANGRLMATAVLEPYTGQAPDTLSPGSYIGGMNYLMSCACLVKVVDAKPFMGGYLAKVRGEARLGISGLAQVEPYMRAEVYNMPDQAPSDTDAVHHKVQQLEEIMRDVQNLASKFRCDETACVQQAMWFVNQRPMVPGISAASASSQEEVQVQAAPADPHQQQQEQQQQHHTSSPTAGSSGASTSTAQAGISSSSQQQQHQSVQEHQIHSFEEEEEPLDLEKAVRLSYAAIQWLPESTDEERFAVVKARLLAMDVLQLPERLNVALTVMSHARASLAAKCALMSM